MRFRRTMVRTLAILSTLMVANSSAQGRTLRDIYYEGNLSKGDGATDPTGGAHKGDDGGTPHPATDLEQ